ncbi:acyl carrier protein [Streptomyces sp. NPDC001165]|uniref:acyl carrier protein n=1 Tax=Streptomyces sp. NPDC001165 TaxID=3364546 RepID=UPI0036C9B020
MPAVPARLDADAVKAAVKRLVIAESRLSVPVARVADDEPLNGPLLNVSSFGLVGMLMSLEDELATELADDVFLGRKPATVADLVEAVLSGARTAPVETDAS